MQAIATAPCASPSALPRNLAAVMGGALAPCAATLVLPDDPRPAIGCADLLEPALLGETIARFGAAFPGGDRRAVASLWSQWYFGALMPPVVAAALLLGRDLPVALAGMHVILTPDATPAAMRIPHEGATCAGDDAVTRLEPLVWEHLAPAVDGLAACARLAPRVLWSNAASLYAWIVAEIAHDPSVPAAVVAGAEAVMLRHHWPDGRRNPLHAPPRTAGERRRRVCCLRYLLPQLARCSTCPLTADVI